MVSDAGVILNLEKNHEVVKDQVTERAKEILEREMPIKVLKLNELMEQYTQDLGKIQLEPQPVVTGGEQKRQKRDGAEDQGGEQFVYPSQLETNKKVVEYWEILRAETIDIHEMTASLKVWIQLNVPKIEDGNNFGVGIQAELIEELQRAEESAGQVLDTATRYHASRAKVVTKCLKYPKNKDYVIAVRELDEKQLINLKICMVDLRNNYAILYDQLNKNMQKLLKPRGDSGGAAHYMS